MMKRSRILLIPLLSLLFTTAVLWARASGTPLFFYQARAAPLEDLPVENWVVCKDLGVGPVPGLKDARQRLELCHPDGYVLRAYCLEPGRQAPPVGRTCTRVSGTRFVCGGNYQSVREYAILQAPTPTSTPTPTAIQYTPSASATQPAVTSTPGGRTPTPSRPRPGGATYLGAASRVVGHSLHGKDLLTVSNTLLVSGAMLLLVGLFLPLLIPVSGKRTTRSALNSLWEAFLRKVRGRRIRPPLE